MKTNHEFWNELLQQGKLYSYVKDGVPHTFFTNILGFAYPIILVIMIIITIIFMWKLTPQKRKWKTYFFSITCGTILGGTGCIFMQISDPQFPGWLFAPWSVTGLEWILTIEDWLFFPFSTSLFYIIYRYVSVQKPLYASHGNLRYIIPSIYICISIVSFLMFKSAGRCEIILFIVPAIILYALSYKSIDLKKFMWLQIFIVLFEVGWDILAVVGIHAIPGMSWASQWTYLTFAENGQAFHSNIFLNYETHGWNWAIMTPLEITPLFGICGGILNYTMFAAGDHFFYSKSHLKMPGSQ